MHSLSNLLKFNEFKNVKKLDFDKMSLGELKSQLKKFESLSHDAKLLSSLSDKGDRVKEQLRILRVRIGLIFGFTLGAN